MLEIKDIHKTYIGKKGNSVHALKGVSFSFPETGLVFILGKSGCGKSTLLNLLGLLDSYDEGSLLIGGKEASFLTERERDTYRALNIGFIFQDFHIIEKYTIGQNVALALEIGQHEATGEEVQDALKKVGLENFENRFARGISGGQRQRVAIARAIAKNPKIILADEPTGNLDSVTSREIFTLLQNIAKENLVVVISHDEESSHRYADKIIELSDGKIVDIYDGDKTTDTIKLEIDSIDEKNSKEIDNLLDDGKKVILVKKHQKEECSGDEERSPLHLITPKAYLNLNKRVRLPLKSSFKLSMLSMRAKWVRAFFTVFLSMLSIAFFGFADTIGQFSVNSVMLQELEARGLSFVNVALVEVDEDSFAPTRYRRTIYEDDFEEFRSLNLYYVPQFLFKYPVLPNFVGYKYLIPNAVQFLNYATVGVVEMDVPADDNAPNVLGQYLSHGRWPRTDYEIVITNFMFERYRRFGIVLVHEGGNRDTHFTGTLQRETSFYVGSGELNCFSQIEGRRISETFIISPQTRGETGRTKKIVGMIDFDLSPYESLMPYFVQETPATREQQQLAMRATINRDAIYNNYIVAKGFMEGFLQKVVRRYHSGFDVSLTLPNQTETTGIVIPRVGSNNMSRLDESVFDLSYIADGTTSPFLGFTKDDIDHSSKQVVMSAVMLWYLLPNEFRESLQGRIDYYMARYGNIPEMITPIIAFVIVPLYVLPSSELGLMNGGAKLHFDVHYPYPGRIENLEINNFQIVATTRHTNIFITDYFFDRIVDNVEVRIGNIFVPTRDNAERSHVLSVLERHGRFTTLDEDGEEYVFNFVVLSGNASDIYFLDSMFSLFVGVFALSALIFAIFATILTYSFISGSINARKKDIGILRSLGAGQWDIAKIFAKEGALLAILIAVFGGLTSFALYNILLNFFIVQLGAIAETFALVSFGFRQILIMASVAIGGVAISVILPILRIARKQPVEVIREVSSE
ncbi:MAG: ABC transporter ATP-binding protein/permease [Firmicutes bacterium]|nr:ABC transporter ATP-binding protein/permease [Bacillota bacterium]